ncbi:MAG: hypothetical protein K2W99_01305 [Chthoniobacterales bacterium]|nr:hypothetical protein [Chthoniobacterales bacterium]
MSNPDAIDRSLGRKSYIKYDSSTQQGYQEVNTSELTGDIGQFGQSKVSQSERPNHTDSNNDRNFPTADHTRPFHKASENPPHLDQRQLSVKKPDRERKLSTDSSKENTIFTDVYSPRSSFDEQELQAQQSTTIGNALVSTSERTASLQRGIHVVEDQTYLPSERQNEIFLEAFVLNNNQISDEEIVRRLNQASPKELFQFSTAFKEAVKFLLDSSEKEQLFTSDLPFQRISLIMENVLQREREIWCFHNTFNNCVATHPSTSKLYQDLEKRFKLSRELNQKSSEENQGELKPTRFGEYSDLCDTHDNLNTIFQSLTQAQKNHSENLLKQEEEDLKLKQLLAETERLTPQLGPLSEKKDPVETPNDKLSNHSKKLQRFSFNQEEEFKEVKNIIYEAVERQALRYFQKIFYDALRTDPQNKTYQTILTTINNKLKDATPSQEIAPIISEKVEESGLMGWVWSLLGYSNSTEVSPSSPPNQLQAVVKDQEWIEKTLNNSTELARIKTENPENPHSRVTALDQLLAQDPALIITGGGITQQEAVQPETKPAWSAMRFGRWLFRTEEDKTRYREGIIAARTHVGSKYGPDAVERFDAHFALRYRKGSPLTVRALNEFVLNEEKLLTRNLVLPNKLSQGVVSLNVNEVSLDGFSEEILNRAKAEFDLRYYIYDSTTNQLKWHDAKEISKEGRAVLFASFYQDYLQRPVVISREIPQEIKGQGFLTSRWNAFWASGYHGSHKKTNQELEEKLTEWVSSKATATSQLASKQKITEEIHRKLQENKKLTLQDVDDVIAKATGQLDESNTWANFFFYRVYKPIVGTVAAAAGVAAGAALVANNSSMATGAAKAAALGAALYAIGEDRPGVQLSTALATLWAANHPKAVHGVEHTVVSYVKGAVKYGALTLAAAHFPPLFLALPFV